MSTEQQAHGPGPGFEAIFLCVLNFLAENFSSSSGWWGQLCKLIIYCLLHQMCHAFG